MNEFNAATNALSDKLPNWLTQPPVITVGEAVLGFILILFVFGLLRKMLARRIKDPETRYHTRKVVTFLSYFIIILYLAGLFSDSLGHLTVVFGVVGAGIAFALQEVM